MDSAFSLNSAALSSLGSTVDYIVSASKTGLDALKTAITLAAELNGAVNKVKDTGCETVEVELELVKSSIGYADILDECITSSEELAEIIDDFTDNIIESIPDISSMLEAQRTQFIKIIEDINNIVTAAWVGRISLMHQLNQAGRALHGMWMDLKNTIINLVILCSSGFGGAIGQFFKRLMAPLNAVSKKIKEVIADLNLLAKICKKLNLNISMPSIQSNKQEGGNAEKTDDIKMGMVRELLKLGGEETKGPIKWAFKSLEFICSPFGQEVIKYLGLDKGIVGTWEPYTAKDGNAERMEGSRNSNITNKPGTNIDSSKLKELTDKKNITNGMTLNGIIGEIIKSSSVSSHTNFLNKNTKSILYQKSDNLSELLSKKTFYFTNKPDTSINQSILKELRDQKNIKDVMTLKGLIKEFIKSSPKSSPINPFDPNTKSILYQKSNIPMLQKYGGNTTYNDNRKMIYNINSTDPHLTAQEIAKTNNDRYRRSRDTRYLDY